MIPISPGSPQSNPSVRPSTPILPLDPITETHKPLEPVYPSSVLPGSDEQSGNIPQPLRQQQHRQQQQQHQQQPPRTPSFDSTNTPHLSSPDTPYGLQTPNPLRVSFAPITGKRSMDSESGGVTGEVEVEVELEGLGYGDLTAPVSEEQRVQELGIGPSSPRAVPPVIPTGQGGDGAVNADASPEGEGELEEFPSMEELRGMQDRLAVLEGGERTGDSWAERDESLGMVKKLLIPALSQLPFLRKQIEAQRNTIRTMQHQTRLSEAMNTVERDRHTAERLGWQAETKALHYLREREIAAGIRPKKLLDLDVGYHQELEAANKRLEMDNRLMAPRLADTQRQIDKLVTELRYLRSHVVLSSGPLASSTHPSPESKLLTSSPAKPIHTTMGDARTEHLLLAARKVRAMRATDDRVGRLTLEELRKGGVVGPDGGLGYSEGYGEVIEEEDEEEEEESDQEDEKPFSGERRASTSQPKAKIGGTPLLPRAKRGGKKQSQGQPPTTPRSSRNIARPQTTPGGSNFNDLLRAAEMATRPATPTSSGHQPVPMSAMSATRSTTRARDDDASERGSPVKRPRRDGAWTGDESRVAFTEPPSQQTAATEEEPEASALDLLAQASQLDVAQSQTTDEQTTQPPTQFGSPFSNTESALGPAIDLRTSDPQTFQQSRGVIEDHQIDPALTTPAIAQTPKSRARGLSMTSEIHTPARNYHSHAFPTPDAFDETPRMQSPPSSIARSELFMEPPLGAYASPTGATVPGLGKYVHLTSSMPAKRIRSPYLKWTVEEDELLARAVAIHGEKWDLVSKGVPTRSYHQVRQRWLRKTGAFDKKPQIEQVDEDDDGSPTPMGGEMTPVGGKKRRISQSG